MSATAGSSRARCIEEQQLAHCAPTSTKGDLGSSDVGTVRDMRTETRDFEGWIGRREREHHQEQILELCRSLNLACTFKWRRAIPLRFNLTFYVSGEPDQLDAFGERYGALLVARVDELAADAEERRARTRRPKRNPM